MTNKLQKIAIPFHYKNDIYNDVASEFNILFFQSRNRLEDLIEFIQQYSDKRINIKFPEGIHLPTLKSISAVSENIFVMLNAFDMMAVQLLQDNNIKFFFGPDLPIGNYTNLDAYMNLGVSDIYPVDDLCYNIKEVAEYCHDHDVHLRLILNHIPSTSFDKGLNPRAATYRPQDIDELNKYYDIFEFDCGDNYDWAEFGVLYSTWFEKKYWHGSLAEINKDLQVDINNDTLYPDFTKQKLFCQRKCNQKSNSYCKKCTQWLEVSEILSDKHVRFVKQ